jgi:protease I
MDGSVTRGLKTGLALAAAAGASMMISSAVERGSPWAGINAMVTASGVGRLRARDRFDSAATPVGLLLLTGGLLALGVASEPALGAVRRRSPVLAGALSGLGAYAIDRFVLPDRVLRDFRRKMGPAGTAAKVLALALASAVAAPRIAGRGRIAGKRIAVLVADGFEQIEVTVPIRALRAAGAEVDVISLRHGKIVGMNLDTPGRSVRVDRTVDEASPGGYDGLFLPGGFINPDLLRQSESARGFARAFVEAGKPVAVLCHGPWLLASAGLLAGRRITSWPGIRDDLVNAGGVWRDEAVVRDGNLVSSRGPQDLRAFTQAMVDLFAGVSSGAARAEPPASSSPQRSRPPALALAGAALLPKAWRARRLLGTAAAVGALGAALLPIARVER